MANLGAFAADFASLRRVMAAGNSSQPVVRWKLFATAAAGAARCVSRGLSRADAADALRELAHANGLIDETAIQDIVAEAFEDVIDVVPLPLDEPPANGVNGRNYGTHSGKTGKQPNSLVAFKNIRLITSTDYAVKGIIPRDGVTVIWGVPKCGKSFWTFDLCMHLVMGWEYYGHRVRQGAVIYLALEGGSGFNKRIVAWRQQHGIPADTDAPFYLRTIPIKLASDAEQLIADIRAMLGPNVSPIAVVVDTLNRAIRGSENESADMGKIIAAGDVVRQAFGCAFLFIHHPGVGGDRMRGHTSLPGALDCEIHVQRDAETSISTATVEAMRDGETGATLAFKLEQVDIGVDDEGDQITTCIIHPAADDSGPAKAKKATGQWSRALELLREVIAAYGQKLPEHCILPPSVAGTRDILRVVEVGTWRSQCYAKMYATETGGTKPGQKSESAAEKKRKAFNRALKGLQDVDAIDISGDWVWIKQTPEKQRDNGT
jgi:AAA domain